MILIHAQRPHQPLAKVARIFANAKIATLLAVCWMSLLADSSKSGSLIAHPALHQE